jgi:hypothetical protein
MPRGAAERAPVAPVAADGEAGLPAPSRLVEELRAGRWLVALTALAVFLGLLAADQGLRRNELEVQWQLLDLATLGRDPLGSLWYLHTQPPLYNLLVGLVAWSPLPLEGTLFVLFGAAFAVMGLALRSLLVRWGLAPMVASVVASVAIINPTLPSTVTVGTYDVLTAMLLVATLWAVQTYLDEPVPRRLYLLAGLLTATCLTRTMLHPAWLLAVLAAVLVARPVSRRVAAAAVLVPLLLIGGWMAKNWVVFDRPTLSSWVGFNMSRGVTGLMELDDVRAAVADGTASPLALENPWQPLERYEGLAPVCAPTHDNPLTSSATKFDVEGFVIPNFNAECYLPLYDQARDDAVALIKRSPVRYLRLRVEPLLITFRRVDPASGVRATWMDTAFQRFLLPVDHDIRTDGWQSDWSRYDPVPIEVSATLVAAAVALLAGTARAGLRLVRAGWRARHDWAAQEVVWLLAGLTVGLIIVGSSLIEFGENPRFRSTVDPLLVALPAAWVVSAVAGRRRRLP